MITMRRQLLGLGMIAASSLLALNAAHAMSGPTAIQIDGGPLGALQISGGVDGYAYYLTGTHRGPDEFGDETTNPLVGSKSNGFEVGSALIELQKTTGELQFTLEVGSNGGTSALGYRPGQTSITTFTTGPLYAGYVTIAPKNLPITVSIGQLGSLEGWESGVDWNNANQLTTDIFFVQNSQSRGVSVNYTQGPINATATFGDGFDSGVFNFLQGLVTYTIDPNNAASIYAAGNLGRTGLNTFAYGCGSADREFCNTGTYGANYANSNMIGGFYSYTMGSLNLVPEAQYVYAKVDHKLGLDKESSNFGAAVFADYTLGTSPYSLGGWVEYENSIGPDYWFIGTRSEAVGIAVTPTYQYKDIFARASLGDLYLLRNKDFTAGDSYGKDGTDKNIFQGELEAGLLF
jgi:hypothetical protein